VEESKLNEYIQYLQEGLNPGDVNLICQDPSTTSGGANPNPNNQNNEPGSGGSTDNELMGTTRTMIQEQEIQLIMELMLKKATHLNSQEVTNWF